MLGRPWIRCQRQRIQVPEALGSGEIGEKSRSSNGDGDGIRMCVVAAAAAPRCPELYRCCMGRVGDEGGTPVGSLFVCFAGGIGGCLGEQKSLAIVRPMLSFVPVEFIRLLLD